MPTRGRSEADSETEGEAEMEADNEAETDNEAKTLLNTEAEAGANII